MENRICALCGEEFTPTHPRQKVCTKQHYRKCLICGTDIPIRRPSDPKRVCSEKCEYEMRRRHNVEKWGVSHPMQLESVRAKHRASMQDVYGVDSPLQSEEIKARAIKTNLERFGSVSALGNQSVRDKRAATMLEKYGVAEPLSSPELRKRAAETIKQKYGVDHTTDIPGVRETAIRTCIDRYGVRNPMMNKAIALRAKAARIKKHGKFWTSAYLKSGSLCYATSSDYIEKISESGTSHRISGRNRLFGRKLGCRGIDYELEYAIGVKAYDIHILDSNILIEIDPTYTHSVIPNHMRKEFLPKDKHKEETAAAVEAGFRCIHVFDWDDQDMIADSLCKKTVIYARKCTIKKIDSKTASEFERENHFQGSCLNQQICYGLYHNDALVSVMTFGAPRYNKNYQYELLRLCTLRKHVVVGGAEKMFKAFIRECNPKSIISYCDLAKFTGDVYIRLGFKHLRDTTPNMVWSKKHDKITNNLLLARGFDQLFGTDYGKGTSNNELMIQHGWRPVFDCGQGVFVYES